MISPTGMSPQMQVLASLMQSQAPAAQPPTSPAPTASDAVPSSTGDAVHVDPNGKIQSIDFTTQITQVDQSSSAAKAGDDLPNQLASYVKGLVGNVQSQYSDIMGSMTMPAAPNVPGGGPMYDHALEAAQMMGKVMEFQLTMSAGDMLRSVPKGVIDKALEMKD